MINISPIPFIPKRKRIAPAVPTLTLVAATYDSTVSVTLTFDHPIDVSAMEVGQVTVIDGPRGEGYQGINEPTLINPRTVMIELQLTGKPIGPVVILNASSDTGIVADNGATWSGVEGLELPFP